MNSLLSYRELSANSKADISRLQGVLEAAPGYYRAIQAEGPSPNEALKELTSIPEGHPIDRKHFFLIEQGKIPVGCIDILRAHPESGIAFIGLLLLVDSCQGRGLGREALEFVIETAAAWDYGQLRAAVVQSNRRALAFWEREGFVELYTKASTRNPAPVVVMSRVLQ